MKEPNEMLIATRFRLLAAHYRIARRYTGYFLAARIAMAFARL